MYMWGLLILVGVYVGAAVRLVGGYVEPAIGQVGVFICHSRLKTHPPETSSQPALALWMCGLHNEVNERLGKPQFDCSKVQERWLHGWKDGSCNGK